LIVPGIEQNSVPEALHRTGIFGYTRATFRGV
jgi:hypothetical protein